MTKIVDIRAKTADELQAQLPKRAAAATQPTA